MAKQSNAQLIHDLTEQIERASKDYATMKKQRTKLRAENHLMRQWIEEHGGDVKAIIGSEE